MFKSCVLNRYSRFNHSSVPIGTKWNRIVIKVVGRVMACRTIAVTHQNNKKRLTIRLTGTYDLQGQAPNLVFN